MNQRPKQVPVQPSGNSVQSQQYRATLATDGEEAAQVRQSIQGSLRPRKNVAPIDPNTGMRVTQGTKNVATPTSVPATQYPEIQAYRRTLEDMGAKGLLRGVTAADYAERRRTAQPPNAGVTSAPVSAVGTAGQTPENAAASGGTSTARGSDPYYSGKTDQLSGYRSWMQSLDSKYGGSIMAFDPGDLTGDDLGRYYYDRSAYIGMESALTSYDAEVEKARKEAEEKERYAAYRRAMMEKYLPETLKAMGFSGRGTSESAVLQMNNNLDNYVAGAKSEQSAAETEALREYRRLAAQMMQERNNQQLAELERDEAERKAELEKQEAEQKAQEEEYAAYYDQLVAGYLSGSDFDVGMAKQYLDMGLIDQSHYDKFMGQYNTSTLSSLQSILSDDSISQKDKAEAYNAAMKDAGLSDETKAKIKEMFGKTQQALGDIEAWKSSMTLQMQNISQFVDDQAMAGRSFKIVGDGIAAEDIANRFDRYSNNVDHSEFIVDVGLGKQSGKAGKRFYAIKEAALNGSLADGSVVDFNYGNGTEYYVFLNGRFYKLKEI